MITLHRSQLPDNEAQVRLSLTRYLRELEAHKKTVGVPAPWPDFEILRTIVAGGGEFLVVEDEELAKAPLTQAQALAEVDRHAGLARSLYITAAPGQDAVYLLKREQATAFAAAGYPGQAVPEFVQAEVDALDGAMTAAEAADSILKQAAAWETVAASIETARRRWKIRIWKAAAPY